MTEPTVTAHAAPAAPRVLLSIQTLRALAAYAVLLFHLRVFSLGFAGVDVFFVISGFIMGTIGVHEAPATFLRRRIVRVVPLYWAVTLGICLLSLIPHIMPLFRFSLSDIVCSLLFIPYVNDLGQVWPLVVQGWTLNYEMFFYVVFAACLLTPRPRIAAIAVLVLLALAGLAIRIKGPLSETYTSPLLLEFASGLLLSWFNPVRGRALALVAMALGAIGFILMSFYGDLAVPGFTRPLFLGVPSYLLVAGALALELAGHWPTIPLARLMGDASYSLYLTHGQIVRLIDRVAPSALIAVVAGLILPALFALAVYRLFEKPVTRLFR